MHRRPAALLASTVVLVLVGCGAAPTGPSEPGAPAHDPETWGIEWARVAGTGPLEDDAADFEVFGAAGAIWLYDAEAPTVLHTTSDGAAWTTWDLADHGLPAEAFAVTSVDGLVRDDRGDAVTLVYGSGATADHPAGLLERMWLVDIAGEEVTVTAGVDVGLEAMPAAEGGWDFRTRELRGFASLGDTRYAIGDGQWWQPFKTGGVDAFAATETDAGWSVFSTDTPPLGGSDYLASPVAIETLGDHLVVVTDPLSSLYPFEVWLSSDGVAWESVAPTFEGAGAEYRVTSVTAGAAGIVAVGVESAFGRGTGVAWASADGREWTRTVLPGGEEDGAPETVVATDAGFLVVGEAAMDTAVWTSPDGVEWTRADAEMPSAVRNAVPVAGGLVAVGPGFLLTSGLDWGGVVE